MELAGTFCRSNRNFFAAHVIRSLATIPDYKGQAILHAKMTAPLQPAAYFATRPVTCSSSNSLAKGLR